MSHDALQSHEKFVMDRINKHHEDANKSELERAKQICEQAGLAVVPSEPSESVINLARNVHWENSGCQLCSDDYMKIYKAMLEAAKEVKP